MENASKALIIAGAILLSILIIGLGMMIYNQAKDATDVSGTMDELKASQYNADYIAYEGTKVSGSNVKTLIEKVRVHNINAGDDDSLLISINGKTDKADLTTLKKDVKSGSVYEVTIKDYSPITGYITEIEYTEAGKSGS